MIYSVIIHKHVLRAINIILIAPMSILNLDFFICIFQEGLSEKSTTRLPRYWWVLESQCEVPLRQARNLKKEFGTNVALSEPVSQGQVA